MKKTVAILLVLVTFLLLSACKNDAIKNVESQINTLNADSTYSEINSVYSAYIALSSKEEEKVENLDVLRKYCDPIGGEFVLTDEMLQIIKEDVNNFETVSFNESAITKSLNTQKSIYGWSKYGDVKLGSHKQYDSYTYCAYGTFKYADEYGKVYQKNFTLSYFAVYSDEKSEGYRLTYSIRTHN